MKFLFPQIFSLKHVVTSSSIWLYFLWHPFETIRDAGSYSLCFIKTNFIWQTEFGTTEIWQYVLLCVHVLIRSKLWISLQWSNIVYFITNFTKLLFTYNQSLIFFIASYSMWIDLWWYLIGSDLAVQSLNINMFSWFLCVFTCIFVCLQSLY